MHISHGAWATYPASKSLPLPFLLLSLVARWVRGGSGERGEGLLGKLQLATTDFLDTIPFKGLVSCFLQVNTKDCDAVGNYCLFIWSSIPQPFLDSCPDCVSLGDIVLVGIGDAGESSSGLLQYFQRVGDGLVVLHISMVSELNLNCKSYFVECPSP